MTRELPRYYKCIPGNETHCDNALPITGCNGKQVANEECSTGHTTSELQRLACDYAVSVIASGEQTRRELYLFLLTMLRYEPSRMLYLMVDEPIKNWLTSQPAGLQDLRTPHLLPFNSLCPGSPDCALNHSEFKKKLKRYIVLQRMVPMRAALRDGHRGVLALDSDFILLQPLPAMGPEDLGLMPCNCHFNRIEKGFGRYSGGMLFARRVEVLSAWAQEYETSRYYDQAALDRLELAFTYFLLGASNNVNFQHTEVQSARYVDLVHGRGELRKKPTLDHAREKVGKFWLNFSNDADRQAQRNGTAMWRIWPGAPVVPLRSLHVHLVTNKPWWFRFINISFGIIHRSSIRHDLCIAYPEFCTYDSISPPIWRPADGVASHESLRHDSL